MGKPCPVKGHTHDGKDCPGAGRIRCRICDRPVAEHAIGWCPETVDRIVTDGPSRRTVQRREAANG